MDRAFLETLSLDEAAIGAILGQCAREDFDRRLDAAITRRRGRSVRAIRAMLDVESLQGANQQAIDRALDQVRRENSYLFEDPPVPYAPGAGSGSFQQKDPAAMTMAEYRAYRKGLL